VTPVPGDVPRLLARHLGMLVLLCVSATVAAALLSYLLPEKYEARALVLVKPQADIKITSNRDDRELLNIPLTGMALKTDVPSNTYIEVIKSRAVAEKVVRLLHLDAEPVLVAPTLLQRLRRAVANAAHDVAVRSLQLLKYGRVIGAPPPFEEAVEAFQTSIHLAAIKDSYQFEIRYLGRNASEAAAVANAAADRFLEHMAELNGAASRSTAAFLDERVQQSSAEVARARESLRQFKENNKTVSFAEETAESIKIIAGLESDLEKANVKLAGLLQDLTPSNPKVVALTAERDRLSVALARRRTEMRALPETERQLAVLTADLRVAEEIHQLLAKEHEQALVRAGRQLKEIELVSRAVAPLYPAKPIKGIYAAAAFIMSAVLGIGLVLLREHFDTAVKTIEDVERVLEVPVLATLPLDPRSGSRNPGSRDRQRGR